MNGLLVHHHLQRVSRPVAAGLADERLGVPLERHVLLPLGERPQLLDGRRRHLDGLRPPLERELLGVSARRVRRDAGAAASLERTQPAEHPLGVAAAASLVVDKVNLANVLPEGKQRMFMYVFIT